MVLVKNWPFFHVFFKGNIGQENVFYDILERKNALLGLVHGLKLAIFPNFFLRQYSRGKCVF